ncbi:cationic amino acid transporter 2-like [Anticarsia gemmatalis]|uniref:cationic amino acid transporter 2-like n=1 Tax=Anticarsia gemmatalis TaxID=129554 RepID=UPI003F769D5E
MAEGKWHAICRIVQRKRKFETQQLEASGLRRCLNCWDLTSMGVGSTLGIGVYVIVGVVAMKIAGPSILLSFLIAAVTSLFAGLCYAEFGARVPLAGSAFIYAYVSIGELVAFIVGWNNILEFTFGSASVARGLSEYVDAVTNHTMSSWFLQSMPVGVPLLSSYFDLLAFLFVAAIGLLLAFGVRESSTVNNVFSVINFSVIMFAIVAGAFKADASNWSIAPDDVPSGHGVGGFFPYGVWGTLRGAAVCFYGFVGFDVVNASGEEVKNPRRTIPIAILSILFIVLAAYAGISIVVTMMVPYYELATVASISKAFHFVGWEWAEWTITVGAIFGISTSLFGSLFPLPRMLYSMASDGLFLHWFAKTSANRKSPVIATAVPTIFVALLAGLLELEQLVMMMCIGTLTSYTIVATCVILLRYSSDYVSEVKVGLLRQMIGRGERNASQRSKMVINIALPLYICMCIAIAMVTVHTSRPLAAVVTLHVVAILIVVIMALQPHTDEQLTFKTPLVPFLPCLSIYANIHLMVIINWNTWLRVFIWLLLGIPIYFICVCCYKQSAGMRREDNETIKPHLEKNGKQVAVQIVVVSPTPPETLARFNSYGEQPEDMDKISNDIPPKPVDASNVEQMTQEIQIENNEEKEAKIIDLLDQVLQAEEDSYVEIISLKDKEEEVAPSEEASIPHRKSLSELSDAGSDASLGNQVLSKYDVIAQVHREDLPKVNEEEERVDNLEEAINNEDEEITAFNESETNSRTDESGYSDTIDRPTLSGSLEDTNAPNIPVPPPFDENYFKNVPVAPTFKKFNTISSRHSKGDVEVEEDDVNEPRLSIKSTSTQGEENIRFGSSRQMKFMNKLNDIFQKTIDKDDEEPRKRSQSTGNVAEAELAVSRERPQIFLDLKKELLARESLPNLTPVNTEVVEKPDSEPEEEEEEVSMSREDLKSKLENIFAVGGPQLIKPRLMKSNPPTPEESYQTDHSSTESIPKFPKMEKNDTLKRQKEKFGHVLNSIRLSMNKDDEV